MAGSNCFPPIVESSFGGFNIELLTDSEDEIKVWVYLMTQYNLKPGLRTFGAKGQNAAIDKLTQLHIMDMYERPKE